MAPGFFKMLVNRVEDDQSKIREWLYIGI